jgi:hypothetical protein
MAYRYSTNRLDVEFRKRIQGVVYDPTPVLGGDLNLGDSALVANFTAQVAITGGQLCCLSGSGKMVLADANSESTCSRLLGIAVASLSTDESGPFYIRGFVDAFGHAPGEVLWVDTTAGEWNNLPPDEAGKIARVIGYGLEANKLFLDPDRTWIEIG